MKDKIKLWWKDNRFVILTAFIMYLIVTIIALFKVAKDERDAKIQQEYMEHFRDSIYMIGYNDAIHDASYCIDSLNTMEY